MIYLLSGPSVKSVIRVRTSQSYMVLLTHTITFNNTFFVLNLNSVPNDSTQFLFQVASHNAPCLWERWERASVAIATSSALTLVRDELQVELGEIDS
jgi:hypothetical protein